MMQLPFVDPHHDAVPFIDLRHNYHCTEHANVDHMPKISMQAVKKRVYNPCKPMQRTYNHLQVDVQC